jgi:5-formyltetrahydrofolate cyclo-ligase
MLKADLRNIYKAKRKALTTAIVNTYTNAIKESLATYLDSLYEKVTLGTYAPINKHNEIDALTICTQQNTNLIKKIGLPKILNEENQMDFFEYTSQDQLQENDWNILEPTSLQKINPKEIDIILVPLLCFDTLGHRVGYGKGYYDKYLKQLPVNTPKIGLCLFEALEDKISDTHTNDVPLSHCITPSKFYEFK